MDLVYNFIWDVQISTVTNITSNLFFAFLSALKYFIMYIKTVISAYIVPLYEDHFLSYDYKFY